MSLFSRAVGAVGGAVSGGVKAVGGAVGGAAGSVGGGVARIGQWTGRGATYTGRLAQRGLTAASRVPGASSALTVMTGGAAALVNKDIAAGAVKEFATGAAVGGSIFAAESLGSPAARAETSPGALDAIDAQAGGGAGWLGTFLDENGRAFGRPATARTSPTTRTSPGAFAELDAGLMEPTPPDGTPGAAPSKVPGVLLAGGGVLVALVLVFLMLAPRRK